MFFFLTFRFIVPLIGGRSMIVQLKEIVMFHRAASMSKDTKGLNLGKRYEVTFGQLPSGLPCVASVLDTNPTNNAEFPSKNPNGTPNC